MTSATIDAMETHPDKLKLLGDPTRFRILEFLAEPIASCCSRDDGVCGCDLETYLGLTQPTVSHHMKQLVDAGLVSAERRGRWVYYELVPEALRELAAALAGFAAAAEARPKPSAA
jgi:ArsR family transcriptional regulator